MGKPKRGTTDPREIAKLGEGDDEDEDSRSSEADFEVEQPWRKMHLG